MSRRNGTGGRIAGIVLLISAISCRSGPSGPAADGVLYPEQVLTLAERRQEIGVKLERMRRLLREEGLAGLLASGGKVGRCT